MPLEPTNPQTASVTTVTSKSITHFQVTHLHIRIDPNDASDTKVEVHWSEGYMSGESFVAVRNKSEVLSGPDVISKINETTDGVSSVYDEVKTRVWEMLQAEGFVPEGSIT